MEDLQPLYQAIAHGCEAGLQEEVRRSVYRDRTLKGTGTDGFYSIKKLGAFGADLGAVACFFQVPWRLVSPSLTKPDQGWILTQAAFDLRGLGRLFEAIEPTRAALEMTVKENSWKNAAASCSLMYGLRLALGQISEAAKDAKDGVVYSDRVEDRFPKMVSRINLGNALHEGGSLNQALEYFREAEAMDQTSEYPYLASGGGAQYCDLLLSTAEHVAWQITLNGVNHHADRERKFLGKFTPKELEGLIDDCQAISERATQGLWFAEKGQYLLDIGLDHQTLCRAALCTAILSSSGSHLKTAITHGDRSMDHLRRCGDQRYVPRGLLTRARVRSLMGNLVGPDSSRTDLDEAWEIAETGPMRLHLADIHLHRARLFFREKSYPWESPEADLAATEELINECGYHRRDAELADAKQAIEQFRNERA